MTDERVERVLDELVAGFKQGKVVQPDDAVFAGRPSG
jgi:hypothetical protein